MVLVIFGATGDLSRRMLFPSLYHLSKSGKLPKNFSVVAFGRREFDNQGYTHFLLDEFRHVYGEEFQDESWQNFSEKIEYFKGDLENESDFSKLGERIIQLDNETESCLKKVFYLAVSADHYKNTFNGIQKTLEKAECQHSEHVKVVVEKPFGESLESFDRLNSHLLELFSEEQIFRIDHYLGKETVQNILYFRAANPLFINDWSNKTVSKVEVNVMETLGVGSRADYYDRFGQTKDMVQSHLLQLLALALMELPDELTTEKIAKAKIEILRNLKIHDLGRDVKRGQYIQGVVKGKRVESYEEDLGRESGKETYVEINAKLNLPKWEGVEILLRSGKRMSSKSTNITLYFKSQEKVKGLPSKNKITFEIQPEESITLDLLVKKPGTKDLDTVPMVFEYDENFKGLLPDAYEQLLLNVFNDNKSSFITSEELDASWGFVDPIINYWEENNPELIKYPAGSKEV